MVGFRDDNILVISPGSETTLANAGLAESLATAQIEIPTRVYRHPDAPHPNYFKSRGEESDVIYPIQGGKLVNVPAFCYLLKLLHKHAQIKANQLHHSANSPIALLLLSTVQWSRLQIEEITQYVFETLKIPGFAIVPTGLASTYSHNLADALVIDIGKDKTEITPVNEYAVVEHAQRVIPYGGNTITEGIVKLLPDLSLAQAEQLKKSDIYEVLNEDDTKSSWFGVNGTTVPDNNSEEDGVVDIAAIVSSGRTREILDERERQKKSGDKQKSEVPNKDRETNTFVDGENKTIEVGKERFHGTEELVKQIVASVGEALSKIDFVHKRQDCWDNVVIVGRGSSVKGLKEAILVALQSKYVILRSNTYSEVPSTFATGHNTPNGGTPMYSGMQQQQHNQGHGQVPTSIRLAKMAEYFPEWKGHGWEDVAFLGGQIAAKGVFSGQVDNSYLTRTEYSEVGPSAIWDI